MWKSLIILALLTFGSSGPLTEADRLFSEEKYEEVLLLLEKAKSKYPTLSQQVSYNMGLVYLRIDNKEAARDAFFQALSPLAPKVASLSSNQIALQLLREGRGREALSFFREALLFDPNHENARYNYELLALRLGQNQPPKKNSPPPPSQNPPPSGEEMPQTLGPEMQKLLEKLESRQRQGVPTGDRFREIGSDTLTLAEAYQVLEIMRKQERQYLQQLRKISSVSAEREGRPGW